MRLVVTNTEGLYKGYDELKIVESLLSRVIQDISKIKTALAAITELEEPQKNLQKIIGDIENQLELCRMLRRSMDTVCQAYISCEQRVLDYCDGAITYYEQPSAGFADLSSTATLLHELSFHLEGEDVPWQQEGLK